MNKTHDIRAAQIDDYEIVVGDRSRPEFVTATNAVGDYLATLPLDSTQHNRLVELMCQNLAEAECGAFARGVELGIAAAQMESGV